MTEPLISISASFSGMELQIHALELDTHALNSAAMASSPLLFHKAHIGEVKLAFFPFRNAMITLEIEGLEFEFCIRPENDEYWELAKKNSEQVNRLKRIATIDPEGAAEHALAERLDTGKKVCNLAISLLSSILLSSLRIELRNSSVRVFPSVQECVGRCISLSTEKLILEEGCTCEELKTSAGIFSTVVIFATILWGKEYKQITKTISAEGFQLAILNTDDIQTNETTIQRPQETILTNIKFIAMLLSVRIKDLTFASLDTEFPELCIQFSTREADLLQWFVLKLGEPLNDKPLSGESLGEQVNRKRGAKELWHKATEQAVASSSIRRLSEALHAGYLRQQYARLYAGWLSEIGWRKVNFAGSSGMVRPGNALPEILEMEKHLPVEAIALGRLVARRRVLAEITVKQQVHSFKKLEMSIEAITNIRKRIWEVGSWLLSAVWCHIIYLIGIMINVVRRGIRHLDRKDLAQAAGGRTLTPHATCEATPSYNEIVHRRWETEFSFCIGKGSIEIICATDLNSHVQNKKSSQFLELGNPRIAAYCLTCQKVSISHGTIHSADYLSIICGSLQGEFRLLRDGLAEVPESTRSAEEVIFSSTVIDPNRSTQNMEKDIADMVKTHNVWRQEQIEKWARREWKSLDGTSVGLGQGFDGAKQLPFLVLVMESLLGIGSETKGTGKFTVAAGKVEFSLKCSVFINMIPFITQFLECGNFLSDEKPDTLSDKRHPISLESNTLSMDAVVNESVATCMELVRRFLYAVVPERCLECTVYVSSPRIKLYASDYDLADLRKRSSKLVSITTSWAMVILDLGDLNLFIWSASSNEGSSNIPLMEKSVNINDQWSKLVGSKEWLRKPLLPKTSQELTVSEHDQVGNNVIFHLDGMIFKVDADGFTSTTLFGPSTFSVEASLCSDRFSSLLQGIQSSAASISLAVPMLSIYINIPLLDIMLQVLACYRDAILHVLLILSYNTTQKTTKKNRQTNTACKDSILSNYPCPFTFLLDIEIHGIEVIVDSSRDVKRTWSDSRDNARHYNNRTAAGSRFDNTGFFFINGLQIQCALGDCLSPSFFAGFDRIHLCAIDAMLMNNYGMDLEKIIQQLCSKQGLNSLSKIFVPKESTSTSLMSDLVIGPSMVSLNGPESMENVIQDKRPLYLNSAKPEHVNFETPRDGKVPTDVEKFSMASSSDRHDITIKMCLGKVILAGCNLEDLATKWKPTPPAHANLRANLTITEHCTNVKLALEGGLVMVHTSALAFLMEWLFKLTYCVLSFVKFLTLSGSNEVEDATHYQALEQDSTSQRYLNSPPVSESRKRLTLSGSMDPSSSSNLLGKLVLINVDGFTMVFATGGMSPKTPISGLMLMFHGHVMVETVGISIKCSGDVKQLTVISLLSNEIDGNQGGSSSSNASQMPQFRSGASEVEKPGEHDDHMGKSTALLNEVMEDSSKVDKSNGGGEQSGIPLSEYILEKLTVACVLEQGPVQTSGDCKWNGAWQGNFHVSGLHIAITTREIQMLFSLLSPLSHVTWDTRVDSSKSQSFLRRRAKEEPILQHDIPDGAIVAIKDTCENSFLCVESTQNEYHLVGVPHYTLVGEKALFKVSRQAADKSNEIWFSLLSLHAKNSRGIPFRVHYRPGSGRVDISSTNDKSWELWKCIPYRSLMAEGAGFEVNPDTGVYSDLGYLINQKSRLGLAIIEGVPMLVNQPGNTFKIKVVKRPQVLGLGNEFPRSTSELGNSILPTPHTELQVRDLINVPHVTCIFDAVSMMIMHEAARGMHLLPLLRLHIHDIQCLIQISSLKMRLIASGLVNTEYFEAQSSTWLPIIHPVLADCFYRVSRVPIETLRKIPISMFLKLKKIDVIVSELSLDTCLFLIGALDLAGPYTIRNSPVLINCCKIENNTGVNLICRFDHEDGEETGRILPRQTGSFLLRHIISRRISNPARVSSSIILQLEKPGKGLSSGINISLADHGIVASRARLESIKGASAPGPIIVVDVSRQSPEGIMVSVTPMVKIQNITGIPLEVRCRRPTQEENGSPTVLLENGEIIDDSMAAFDALGLHGELKKALSSFNLGNYLLSIRPASNSAFGNDQKVNYLWSEDLKGAKPVRISGLFEKLQYGLKKTLKSKVPDSSFSLIYCKHEDGYNDKESMGQKRGMHFLVRTARRQVPVTKLSASKHPKRSLVALQEQQEVAFLPTVRMQNFLSSSIQVTLDYSASGNREQSFETLRQNGCAAIIPSQGGMANFYVDISSLFLVVKLNDRNLVSNPVNIGPKSNHLFEAEKVPNGNAKFLKAELCFGDACHFVMLNMFRDEDGILEVAIYTKYTLENSSHISLLCCAPKTNFSRWRSRNAQLLEWPSSQPTVQVPSTSRISWFYKSNAFLIRREEPSAKAAVLDLESLSGSLELSLEVETLDGLVDLVQLGVKLQVPTPDDSNPSESVQLAPRYLVINESTEMICVCQDGFQNDTLKMHTVSPGSQVALHAQIIPGQNKQSVNEMIVNKDSVTVNDTNSLLSVRFRFEAEGWEWSGPVRAAALGSFFLKMKRSRPLSVILDKREHEEVCFGVADIQEEVSSLVMRFRLQSAGAVPYRIENKLQSAAIIFHQKELTASEILRPNSSIGYAWDDLSLPHRLMIIIAGTQADFEINLDKIRPWKSFHHSKGFSFHLPFQDQLGLMGIHQNGIQEEKLGDEMQNMGYEVYADGPTRVLRICMSADSTGKFYWKSEVSIPSTKIMIRVPSFRVHLMEVMKQKLEMEDATARSSETGIPILCARFATVSSEILVMSERTLCQLKVQSVDVDMKWTGAPFAAMLRAHDQDRFTRTSNMLHVAAVISNSAVNPIQLKYASVLLQAIDLNIDEDTLMKLVPFYRTSLAEGTTSRQIYFERFEIHPIKIVASFLPGHPRADYTSAQETLRAVLHSIIKLPTVRGATVELNGVLLSNALLTFRQLIVKCAQHYSWYAMRAIYLARGSKLLPPGFASLFDDSAASSLDVFFDPSSGFIDVQGLALGMFNLLSKAYQRKDQGGTSRYLGDLEKTVKRAGSNLMFAVVTEVSDNVLKGAETNGFDGMLTGLRRGILNVAMKPSVLREVVVKGGPTRHIQLDRSVGMEEAYVEGYLQAMLDVLFKQDYLKVKVVDDQVVLKNLPPNSMLMDDIITTVKNFLIGEGLLSGESSTPIVRALRLQQQGENEKRVVPAIANLCEQLLVIFCVRVLREHTRKILHLQGADVSSKKLKDANEIEPPASGEKQPSVGKQPTTDYGQGYKRVMGNFLVSTAVAYVDGRLCRHIPNAFVRRIISGFLLSFVE